MGWSSNLALFWVHIYQSFVKPDTESIFGSFHMQNSMAFSNSFYLNQNKEWHQVSLDVLSIFCDHISDENIKIDLLQI